MTRPYSLDLRERVVAAVASGRTCRSVASTFSVSVASVVKWSQRQRATGSPAAGKVGGHRRYILEPERDWLLRRVDEDAPRLVIHVDTTPAIVHEAMRTDAIHAALGAKGLAPREHLVDAGYVSAEHLVGACARHGIELVGPTRKEASWQRRTEGAFGIDAFVVDWESKRVRCPEGKESTSWGEYKDEARGRFIRARFRPTDCHACPSKALCTRTTRKRQGRQLTLHAREERKALEAARVRQSTAAGRQLRALRQGIESTISQGVRVFGLRRARYRGLVKTHLQHVATAAALDLNRVVAWLEGRPLAPTRISRFAATAA